MRYKLVLFILFVACGCNISVKAQDKCLADSLKKVLVHCKDDSVKYQVLLTLARNGLPQEGLDYANQAVQISFHGKEAGKKALAYEYVSICQRKLGNNEKAIEASLKALRIYDSLGLDNKTSRLQLQIGSHFTNDKDYNQGIQYIKLALATLRKQEDSKLSVKYALINLGETYRLMGDLDSAAMCFNECLALNREQQNNLVQGYALGNLGMVHAQMSDFEHAKHELNESIHLLKPLGDAYSVSTYQSELARLYIKTGYFTKGEKLLLESLEMVQKEGLKEQIRDINNILSVVYEQNRMYKKALACRKQYEIYQDSLVNIENVRKIEQLHSKYWLDKKEADIQFLEKENKNKHIQVITLSVGVLLLVTLLLILQRVNLQRKKAYRKVSQQKIIIEKREQEKALLLKELNHRVKNNLQMVASLINLQCRQSADENITRVLVATRNRIDTLMLIHQKLYSENEDLRVDLKDYLRELVNNLIYGAHTKVKLDLNLSSILIHIDAVISLGLITNELITNSLKHAVVPGKELQIGISLIQDGTHMYLTIADNGKGMSYEPRETNTVPMGMKLVHSLLKQLHGELKYEMKSGSVWTIILEKRILKQDKNGKYKNSGG